MHSLLRRSALNKYPVSGEQEHATEMVRSLRMGAPHHSKGEMMTLAMLGDGLPSTMSMYHLRRDRGGKAVKLRSALRGMDDEPPVSNQLHPKTMHRPQIFQKAFSGQPASTHNMPFPLLKANGERGPNRRFSEMTRIYPGDAGSASLGAQQYFDRTNGYRSITDEFTPMHTTPDHWVPEMGSSEWVGAYIESGGLLPKGHDDIVHRELTENATLLYWRAVRPLGLHEGYQARQNFLV